MMIVCELCGVPNSLMRYINIKRYKHILYFQNVDEIRYTLNNREALDTIYLRYFHNLQTVKYHTSFL